MSRLPLLSGRQLVRILGKVGYIKDRKNGSHIVLRNTAYPYRRLVVPDHKTIAKGTLRAIVRQAGMTLL